MALTFGLFTAVDFVATPAAAQESLWIEAEHLEGVRGFCWPMGRPDMKTTAGQDKPQQGITPTDYRQNRAVTIVSHVPFRAARDRLLPDETLSIKNDRVLLEVPAGGVRIIELATLAVPR